MNKKRTATLALAIALFGLFAYDYWTMKQELALIKRKAAWSYVTSSETQSTLEELKHQLIAKNILTD